MMRDWRSSLAALGTLLTAVLLFGSSVEGLYCDPQTELKLAAPDEFVSNISPTAFVDLITASVSPKDFAERVIIEVKKAEPDLLEEKGFRRFLKELYGACPHTSPAGQYHFYAEDIATLQETCRMLIETAVIGLTPRSENQFRASRAAAFTVILMKHFGDKLKKTEMGDYRSTLKMRHAARRIFENAVVEGKALKLITSNEGTLTQAVRRAINDHGFEYTDESFRSYPAAMAAARLFERLVAITALSNKALGDKEDRRGDQFDQAYHALHSAGRISDTWAEMRKEDKPPAHDGGVKRTIYDLTELVADTEKCKLAYLLNAQKVIQERVGRGKLLETFTVSKEEVLTALLTQKTSASFLHAFAPYLTIPKGYHPLTQLAEQVKAFFEQFEKDGSDDMKLREKFAEEITEAINKFVKEFEKSTAGDLPSSIEKFRLPGGAGGFSYKKNRQASEATSAKDWAQTLRGSDETQNDSAKPPGRNLSVSRRLLESPQSKLRTGSLRSGSTRRGSAQSESTPSGSTPSGSTRNSGSTRQTRQDINSRQQQDTNNTSQRSMHPQPTGIINRQRSASQTGLKTRSRREPTSITPQRGASQMRRKIGSTSQQTASESGRSRVREGRSNEPRQGMSRRAANRS